LQAEPKPSEVYQATRVLSTPPTIDSKRRRFLAVAAAASVASVGTLAVAAAMPAAGPACRVDPIYAAIERHMEAAIVWDAAVDVWAKFLDAEPMSTERRIEREWINDAENVARDAMDGAGVDLINTSPTTLGGIARALDYIREQMLREDGIYMPDDLRLSDDTNGEYPVV
jgi:hypothetical protein